MSRKTIALAAFLLTVGALTASAAAIDSPAYDQAKDLAAGRSSAASIYDGTPARQAVRVQVQEALTTGGLTPPAAIPAPEKGTDLLDGSVPSPDDVQAKGGRVSGAGLGFAAGGAAAGALGGWLLGGPIGAVIGAAMGFGIGFLLSRLLR